MSFIYDFVWSNLIVVLELEEQIGSQLFYFKNSVKIFFLICGMLVLQIGSFLKFIHYSLWIVSQQ